MADIIRVVLQLVHTTQFRQIIYCGSASNVHIIIRERSS